PVVSRRARRPEDAIATRRQTRGGCGKYIRSLFTILFFAVLLTIGGGWFFWRAMTSPYRGYSEPAKRVEIRKGQRTATILHHLQAEGVIRDEYIPLVYMKLALHNESLKAGVYEFTKPLTPVEVLQKIMRGDVILRTVTVREGLDRFAVGRLFAAEHFGKADEWDRATADAEQIRDIAPEATSLEGY